MTIIYGVDDTKEVTPKMAVSAIIDCFYNAHHSQIEMSTEVENDDINKEYCAQIVKKAFTETNGDIENPTKQSILKVLSWLADFSKNFRNQETIQKNVAEIMKLINLIK